jgi:hypothetical protein
MDVISVLLQKEEERIQFTGIWKRSQDFAQASIWSPSLARIRLSRRGYPPSAQFS